MKLWSYWRSSCAYRVRIALGLKKIDYEYTAVHLLNAGGQQHAPAFAEVNPHRQVPVLEFESDGERVRLVQSMAIIEYLEERFPEPALLPKDPIQRARVRAMAELVNSGIQPLQNTSTFAELTRLGAETKPWAESFIKKGLTSLERLAAPSAGKFLFGDGVSLADIYLVPQLYNARRFGIPLDAFPTLTRAEQNAQALPAFQRAAPERQPDAEPS